MSRWQELGLFLEGHKKTYINDKHVSFNQVQEGLIFIDAAYPGYEGPVELALIFLCNNERDFFEGLGIQSVEEIDRVKPETLLPLYDKGKVVVLCALDDDNALEFWKDDSGLVAISDKADQGHIVEEPTETPEDFIEHTRAYFSFAYLGSIRPN